MDIVERLRLPEAVLDGEICHEAADEIERLTQWQPIETAPKDGKEILVWCPVVGYAVVRAWNGSGERLSEPTHWMPLPGPPNTNKENCYEHD